MLLDNCDSQLGVKTEDNNQLTPIRVFEDALDGLCGGEKIM